MSDMQIYKQVVNGGKLVVLVAEPEAQNPASLMRLAVSQVVQHSMFNEYVDISLLRPFLRLVWLGDLNTLAWKQYNGDRDCEYIEFELKDDVNQWCGRVVFMRGGLYQKNPNQYMTDKVYEYINDLDRVQFSGYNEMVESPLDNPWFRVILLNIDHLTFSPMNLL